MLNLYKDLYISSNKELIHKNDTSWKLLILYLTVAIGLTGYALRESEISWFLGVLFIQIGWFYGILSSVLMLNGY